LTQDTTTRRRRCRPDRALRHAELADLAKLDGVYTLRAAVEDCGGEVSWFELLDRIIDAKEELGERTGIDAAIDALSVLYALHRSGQRGFRGLIGSNKAIAARVMEILGRHRGFSERTARGAWRILERADLVDRWLYGRGKVIAVPSGPAGELGSPQKGHSEGSSGPRARRGTLAVTLTVVAISYWSAPRRGRRSSRVGAPPTPARFADNSILGEEATPLGDAHPSISSAPCPARQRNEVSAVPADDVGRGAPAPASSGERLANGVPLRRYAWRPRPDEPATWGNAQQAVLYDLETVLIRHRRRDRGELLEVVRRELDPQRRIAATTRGSPPARGSGFPWDEWIWRWRGLELADRQVACARMILPAALGVLRRAELWRVPPDLSARLSPARCTERPPDPGPRAVAQPPPASSTPRTRAAPAPPGPLPDWLTALQSRYGGEEDG
jgi:hypothetical protein